MFTKVRKVQIKLDRFSHAGALSACGDPGDMMKDSSWVGSGERVGSSRRS